MFGFGRPRGLRDYIDRALIQLPKEDQEFVQSLFVAGEWALAVEQILDKMTDLDIRIDEAFANETLAWFAKFDLDEAKRDAVRKLIAK